MSKSEDELFNSSVISYKILIVCKGNTCRSIIYHSILSSINKPNLEITSAGYNVIENKVNEKSIQILKKLRIEAAKMKPTNISELSNISFDEVIILDKNMDIEFLKDIEYREVKYHHIDDPKGKELIDYEEVANKCFEFIKVKR